MRTIIYLCSYINNNEWEKEREREKEKLEEQNGREIKI